MNSRLGISETDPDQVITRVHLSPHSISARSATVSGETTEFGGNSEEKSGSACGGGRWAVRMKHGEVLPY